MSASTPMARDTKFFIERRMRGSKLQLIEQGSHVPVTSGSPDRRVLAQAPSIDPWDEQLFRSVCRTVSTFHRKDIVDLTENTGTDSAGPLSTENLQRTGQTKSMRPTTAPVDTGENAAAPTPADRVETLLEQAESAAERGNWAQAQAQAAVAQALGTQQHLAIAQRSITMQAESLGIQHQANDMRQLLMGIDLDEAFDILRELADDTKSLGKLAELYERARGFVATLPADEPQTETYVATEARCPAETEAE